MVLLDASTYKSLEKKVDINDNQSARLFQKCISLMEQRLNLRIKNAVLVFDSDYGQGFVELNDKPEENLMITSRYHHGKLMETLSRNRAGGGIITCDRCLGGGELIEGGLLITCKKCKGGGQVVQILNKEFTGHSDLLESEHEKI